MIKKRDYCLYCGCKMESKRASKKFCSSIHRTYYNREVSRGSYEPPIVKDVNGILVIIRDTSVNPSILKKLKKITFNEDG